MARWRGTQPVAPARLGAGRLRGELQRGGASGRPIGKRQVAGGTSSRATRRPDGRRRAAHGSLARRPTGGARWSIRKALSARNKLMLNSICLLLVIGRFSPRPAS